MSLPPYNHNNNVPAYSNSNQLDRNQPIYHPQAQTSQFQISNQGQVYPGAPQYGLPIARPPPAMEEKSSKRVRVSRACDFCRRKKVKCDAEGPGSICSNCKTYNSECHFNDSAKKRGPPKGYIETLENRLKRMERILGSLADSADSNQSNMSVEHESEGSKSSPESTDDHHKESTIQQQPSPPKQSPEQQQNTPPNNKGDVERRSSKDFIPYAEYERAKYIGDISALHMLTKKYNMEDKTLSGELGAKIHRFGEDIVLVNDTVDGEKGLDLTTLIKHGNVRPEEKIETVADWIRIVAGIDMTMSHRLMRVYFVYIHPILPVVNKVMFLKQYRGQTKPFPSASLLLAMYGAAARYVEVVKRQELNKIIEVDDDWQPPEGWSESFFDELRKFLVGHYTPSMSTVQALLIAQNHRASLDSRSTIVWLICGLDIRMAQDLGLNRSSEKWMLPKSEIETRKRVWWAVYIADKWNSAATGKPVAIFDEDCDVEYPDENADWDEIMDTPRDGDTESPRFPSVQPGTPGNKGAKQPLYQPFVQLAKLSEILGRILRGLYTPKAKTVSMKYGSDAIVTLLDHALTDWRQRLPSSLYAFKSERKGDNLSRHPSSPMAGMIALCYYTVLSLLHRPFIERNSQAQRNAKSALSSLSICTSAAIRCINVAEKMNFRESMLFSWNFVVYPVFSSSIIHIHNANSDDEKLRETAKKYIIKSANLFKRLQSVTANAEQIYQIFVKVLDVQDLDIEEVQADQQGNETTAKSGSDNSRNKKDTIESLSGGRMANLSDVGRGQAPRREQRSGSVASASSLEQGGSPAATDSNNPRPKVVVSLHGINKNSSGNGEQQSAASSPSSPSSNEAYSLRQFGLTMDQLFDPILNQKQQTSLPAPSLLPMPGSPSAVQLNPNMDPYASQTNDIVNLINTPFSSSDLMFGPTMSFFPSLGNVFPQAPAQSPQQPQQPQQQQQQPQQQQQQQQSGDQTMFRHRPENPFWSVPTSLDFDAWDAYYQQRQQGDTSNIQMMNANNNDGSQQQMWQ